MAGLRILGGAARGRRLQGESLPGVRPTPARVREAVFDILGARVAGSAFLDLYAGTGAVGLEALSRGAGRVVFVEWSRVAARAIAANLALVAGPESAAIGRSAEIVPSAEIVQEEARTALRRLAGRGDRFQIAFLDPPWDDRPGEEALLLTAELVSAAGILVCEHRSGETLAFPTAARLRPGRSYRYGDASLSLFHREAGTGAG